MIKNIAFIVYAVTDMKRARKFYERTLGLKPGVEYKGSKNWVEYNIGGGTFAIGSSPDWKPSEDGASAAFEVDDFDKTVARLKKKKISFKLKPGSFPSCSMAVIFDPDKNSLIIHKKNKKTS